jgi:hypothetical protein
VFARLGTKHMSGLYWCRPQDLNPMPLSPGCLSFTAYKGRTILHAHRIPPRLTRQLLRTATAVWLISRELGRIAPFVSH